MNMLASVCVESEILLLSLGGELPLSEKDDSGLFGITSCDLIQYGFSILRCMTAYLMVDRNVLPRVAAAFLELLLLDCTRHIGHALREIKKRSVDRTKIRIDRKYNMAFAQIRVVRPYIELVDSLIANLSDPFSILG